MPRNSAFTLSGVMLDALRRAYDAMAGMIIARLSRFDDVVESIASLEKQFDQVAA